MNPSGARDSAALVQAFASREPSLRHDCPSPEDLYDAAAGQLDPARRHAVVDHVAVCPECTTAWRLAAELQPPAAEPVRLPVRFRLRAPVTALAAAASVVVAVALAMLVTAPSETVPPVYRDGGTTTTLESRVTATSLPRQEFRLRWSAGPAGATYTLRVTDASLTPVYVEDDIAAAEHVVPAAALQGVEGGAQLFWQVEARLPGGSRQMSPTYTVTVR